MKKSLCLTILLIALQLSASTDKYPYSVPPLGYAYNGLEPYIDEATMKLHHDAHHKAYVDNLNAALKDQPALQEKTIEWLLQNLDKIKSTKIRTTVRNNGGGHWNHSFFWNIMQPARNKSVPTKPVLEAIKESFCSFEKFKEKFIAEAKKVFGSGWAWLCIDADKKLVIMSTSNQDTPLSNELTPILGLDVWEHAYYLKYHNKRPDYLNAWWHVVNWNQVEKNYEQALAK
jgi:superoxide dismutase, Fe-Mn family